MNHLSNYNHNKQTHVIVNPDTATLMCLLYFIIMVDNLCMECVRCWKSHSSAYFRFFNSPQSPSILIVDIWS